MNKNILFLLILFIIVGGGYTYGKMSRSGERLVNGSALESVVLHTEGHTMPLDSHARYLLLSINEKSSLNYKKDDKKISMSAVDWYTELLFDFKAACDRPIFKVREDKVIKLMEVPKKYSRSYSFNELDSGLDKLHEMAVEQNEKSKEGGQLNPLGQSIMALYAKVNSFYKEANFMRIFVKNVSFETDEVAQKFDLKKGELFSVYDLYKARNTVAELLRGFIKDLDGKFAKKEEGGSEVDKILSNIEKDKELFYFCFIVNMMRNQSPELFTQLSEAENDLIVVVYSLIPVLDVNRDIDFPLIPPVIDDEVDATVAGAGEWLAPEELLAWEASMPQLHQDVLEALNHSVVAYAAKDFTAFDKHIEEFKGLVGQQEDVIQEVTLNKGDFFYRSIYCYLLAFVMLFFAIPFGGSDIVKKLAILILIIGVGLHTYGLTLRCLIMDRPPVTNLYESMLFVSVVGVAFCLLIEYFYRQGFMVMAGAIIGTSINFMAFQYDLGGDGALEELQPVLRSNFWLATHVLVITAGYALCFIAGVLGHMFLIVQITSKGHAAKEFRHLFKIIVWLSLVALFLCVLGTILGGIWADQSWGRFWGWDPKENGAMLICLWLLFLVHGRISGLVKENGFCAGLIILNIVVVLAWKGVNLLNTGLHSYGFVDGVWAGVRNFTIAELAIAALLYFWAQGLTDGAKAEPPQVPEAD